MLTQDDVVYMIVIDRFADGDPANNGAVDRGDLTKRHGGDLLGIVQRMPYLVDLGITVLWITPVYLNPPDAYHGYHPLNFEQVDPHLCSPELGPVGSPDVVRRFVQIAHEHGLKVMLDAVIDHTALSHPWLQERPSWFNIDTPSAQKGWLWGLPDLNHDRVDVNVYFARNVLEWIDRTGADAVRIDATRHVETGFWQKFKLFVRGLCPTVTIIGEVWDANVAQVAPYQAYHGFDSMADFPLYYAILDVFAHDQGFGRIARPELSDNEPQGILNQDEAYQNAYRLLTFLGNHDTARFFHLAGGDDRPAEALTRMKLALIFLLTTRGIPQLYYGDELAMEGGPHPDNRREMPWERIEGGWGPAARERMPEMEAVLSVPPPPATQGSGLQAVSFVAERLAPLPVLASTVSGEAVLAHEMYHFTRQLIRLRRSSMALRYGLLTTLYLTPTLYAFARAYLDEVRIVVLNNAWEGADVTIPLHVNSRLPTIARSLLPDGQELVNDLDGSGPVCVVDGSLRVQVPAKTGAVYRSVAAGQPPCARSAS